VIEQLLIAALILIPMFGWLLAVVSPVRMTSAIAISAGLTGMIATVWLACLHFGMTEVSARLTAGRWLVIPSAEQLFVDVSFYSDQSRVLLVLAASLVVVLEFVREGRTGIPSESRPARTTAPLYPLSIAAILLADLVVLVSVWVLIDSYVLGSQIRGDHEPHPRVRTRKFQTTTILGCSSVVLLSATLMATSRFGTSDITELPRRVSADGRIDTAAVVSGLTGLFAAAIAVRCAFFPAVIWPRSYLETRPRDAAMNVVLAGVLPGISLAVAMFPLCEVSSDGNLLLGMLGVLTCLTATSIALAQSDAADMLSLLTVSAAGLAAAAFATGQPSGAGVASCTVFAQLVAIFVLRCSRQEIGQRIAFVVAMIVAVSGVCGGNTVLSLVEATLRENVDVHSAATSSTGRFLFLIWWGIVASQILWGVAIVKLTSFGNFPGKSSSAGRVRKRSTPAIGIESAVTTVAALSALGVCLLPVPNATGIEPLSSSRLLAFGAATPACLLGVVVASLLSQASERVRNRVVGSMDSLARLSREWFYVENAVRCGINLPVRGLAVLAGFCDRKLLGGRPEDDWKQIPVRLANSLEFQRVQPAVYYGLTGVLLVVGLLWSLV